MFLIIYLLSIFILTLFGFEVDNTENGDKNFDNDRKIILNKKDIDKF